MCDLFHGCNLTFIPGDMVMPGLLKPQLALEDTINGNVQAHSADGYLFDYAVNLQALNYLQTINVLKREDRERSLEFMQTSQWGHVHISHTVNGVK